MPVGYYGAADVQVVLNDFGVPVTLGATTANGVLDLTDIEEVRGEAATFTGKEIAVLVKTGTFAGLAQGATITVDGVVYKVLTAAQVDDGALTRVLCGRP